MPVWPPRPPSLAEGVAHARPSDCSIVNGNTSSRQGRPRWTPGFRHHQEHRTPRTFTPFGQSRRSVDAPARPRGVSRCAEVRPRCRPAGRKPVSVAAAHHHRPGPGAGKNPAVPICSDDGPPATPARAAPVSVNRGRPARFPGPSARTPAVAVVSQRQAAKQRGGRPRAGVSAGRKLDPAAPWYFHRTGAAMKRQTAPRRCSLPAG